MKTLSDIRCRDVLNSWLINFRKRVELAYWLACPPLVLSVMGLLPARVIPNTVKKIIQTASLFVTHVLGYVFDITACLSKRPGSVRNCLLGHTLKRSPGINCKSRVLYSGPEFLSSATWPLMQKNHYNGLNTTFTVDVAIEYCTV